MTNTYDEFEKTLETIIQLRSKNYVNLDCDIYNLIPIVYDEITNDVVLMWEEEEILLEEDVYIYDIKTKEESGYKTYSKFYTDVTAIVDDNFIEISDYIDLLESNQIRINDGLFLSLNIDKKIHLMRKVKPDITIVEEPLLSMLRPALIEGIMYHIQSAVPTDIDAGKLGNMQYQRFFAAKRVLKEQLPQFGRFDNRQTGSEIKTGLLNV